MKVLALDGGGVLGVSQARTLSRINTTERFDMVVGTSVGTINGALLSLGKIKQAPDFFEDWVYDIFGADSRRRFNLFGPSLKDDNLNAVLQQMLPMKFGDLPIPTLFVAADLARQRMKVFNSRDLDDGEWPCWEVVRACVAAETYFSPWKGYADGGIYANNPSMVAVSGAARHFGTPLSRMQLVSIGTGTPSSSFELGNSRWWTKLHWGSYLLRALLNGSANSMHEHFVSRLPLESYFRYQFLRDESWHFTDPDVPAKVLNKYSGKFDNEAREITKILDGELQ